jgi:hypothetical protein
VVSGNKVTGVASFSSFSLSPQTKGIFFRIRAARLNQRGKSTTLSAGDELWEDRFAGFSLEK